MRIMTKDKKRKLTEPTDIKKKISSWELKERMNNEAIKNMNCSNNTISTTKWTNPL